MANYQLDQTGAEVQAILDAVQDKETTRPVLNSSKLITSGAVRNALAEGYLYKGVADHTTNPGTPTEKVFYIASDPGTYSNFGAGISVADGEVAILKYDTAWHKEVTGAATSAQVTELGQQVDELFQKSASLSEDANYLDKDHLHTEDGDNGYWNASSGAFVKNASYRATEDFIPIEAGETYYVWTYRSNGAIAPASSATVVWYDSQKNFISGQAYRSDYTAPLNARYVRFSFVYYAAYLYMALKGSIAPTEYIPFGFHTIIGDDAKFPRIDNKIADIENNAFKQSTDIDYILYGKGASFNAVATFSGTWLTGGTNKSMVVPIKGNDVLIVKPFSGSVSYIAFLKSFSQPVSGKEVDFATGSSLTTIGYQRTFTAPSDAKYLYIALYDSSDRIPQYALINGYDVLAGVAGELHNLEDRVNAKTISEFESQDASENALVNDQSRLFLLKTKIDGELIKHDSDRILAINHDDFNLTDTIGTRSVYAKYGFNGTFNFILKPFASVDAMNKAIENAKKLLKDGNEIGFHAWFAKSCWFANKMIDIRPDGTFSFAPTLAEVQGNNPDGTGVNSFGDNITAETMFHNIGYIGEYSKVATCTQSAYQDIIKKYCVYFILDDVTGVDLDGKVVTKKVLEWTEYWLNNLVDSSFGYSTYDGTILERFSADYSGTYPTAEQIESGELSGTGNFTKGLFKGAKSCCNMEVTDRIIEVANAFCQHYFGVQHFTSFGRHGERYIQEDWKDSLGVSYDNREKTILTNESGKVFRSLSGRFESQFDILKRNFIKIVNHQSPTNIYANFVGQQGLYYGQNKIRGNYWNACVYPYGATTFLSVFRKGSGNYFIGYDSIMAFLAQHRNPLKYAYENAGEVAGTDDGVQFSVSGDIRNNINVIRSCFDTGKIPALSLDTVADSPNTMLAIELLCRFCYENDIKIVPMEVARTLATMRKRDTSGNIMPNPTFRQTLLEYFGGTSDYNGTYLPDGWTRPYLTDDDGTYGVSTITIEGKSVRELSFTGGAINSRSIFTSAFGLPSGRYKFTAYVKSGNPFNSMLSIGKVNNGNGITGGGQVSEAQAVAPNSEYQFVELYIDIDEPVYDMVQTTVQDKLCLGYASNTAAIKIQLTADAGKTTSIHSPKLVNIP